MGCVIYGVVMSHNAIIGAECLCDFKLFNCEHDVAMVFGVSKCPVHKSIITGTDRTLAQQTRSYSTYAVCGQELSCRFQLFADKIRCGAPEVIDCRHKQTIKTPKDEICPHYQRDWVTSMSDSEIHVCNCMGKPHM